VSCTWQVYKDGTHDVSSGLATSQGVALARPRPLQQALGTTPQASRPVAVTSAFVQIPYLVGARPLCHCQPVHDLGATALRCIAAAADTCA
jgi:hypothetical protein